MDNYEDLARKAKELADKRLALEAQEQALGKQIKDLEDSLVADFGENYMDTFKAAVESIREWEAAHA